MNCLEVALQVSLISESLGVSASFTTMERITLENLMQEVMKLYSLAILPQARHIRFSTKELRELRRASISFSMKTSPLHRHPILRIPFLRVSLSPLQVSQPNLRSIQKHLSSLPLHPILIVTLRMKLPQRDTLNQWHPLMHRHMCLMKFQRLILTQATPTRIAATCRSFSLSFLNSLVLKALRNPLFMTLPVLKRHLQSLPYLKRHSWKSPFNKLRRPQGLFHTWTHILMSKSSLF